MSEGEQSFGEWLEEQRDLARTQYQDSDSGDENRAVKRGLLYAYRDALIEYRDRELGENGE